jgi:programmed cell death 6-interacting protein
VLYLESRKDDDTVRAREHALQSLDIAYHQYRELVRNLDEGLKVRPLSIRSVLNDADDDRQFYNDLAAILAQFKESCRVWSHQRSLELK